MKPVQTELTPQDFVELVLKAVPISFLRYHGDIGSIRELKKLIMSVIEVIDELYEENSRRAS